MTQDEKDKFKEDIIDAMLDVFTKSHAVTVKNSSVTGSDIAVIKEHIKNIDSKIESIDIENKQRNGSVAKAIKDINESITNLQETRSNLRMASKIGGAIVTIFISVMGWVIYNIIELSKALASITH